MSLIDNYRDLEENCNALEAARSGGNEGEFHAYRALIANGRVLLPYLTADGIAFGPSRFLGYAHNTVHKHGELEDRDGKQTTPRIRQVLKEEYGFTIGNTQDDAAEAHYFRFCDTLGVRPSNVTRTYWITPDVGEWLDNNPVGNVESLDHDADDARLEDEVRADKSLPETTRESIIRARVGQGLFRRRVLQAYGRCLVTGLKERRLLVASHIKPWRACRHDPAQCLSPDNALLLSPTWDALFDKGFISVNDEGRILFSDRLKKAARKALGIDSWLQISLTPGQIHFLVHHRELHGFE